MAAELNEIREARRSAVRPVADVMRVDEAAVTASRETAATIPRGERTPQLRRDAATLAADVQRPAACLEERYERGVAGQPASGVDCERDAVIELAATGASSLAVTERRRVHAQDDLIALAT